MTDDSNPRSETVVIRLEYISSLLIRASVQLDQVCDNLSRLGVVPPSLPPEIGERDDREVVRLKERALELHRQREQLEAGLEEMGAKIIDRETMEMILPGGPADGSYLSWQPGEPSISWWRKAPDTSGTRNRLSTADADDAPILH